MISESVDVAKKICRQMNCTSLSGMEFMIAQAIDEAFHRGVEFGKSLRPYESIHGRDCNGTVSPFVNVPGPTKMGL